jgi:FKBP-type peptidyl-prolyl isomerase-like protein
MNRSSMLSARRRSGLTLFELLISIAVVGALGVLLLSSRSSAPLPPPPAAHFYAPGEVSGASTTVAPGVLTALPSGLKYVDLKVGNGECPKPGQIMVVHYTGTLQDGTQFDSSYDHGKPFSFVLGQGAVIKGWDEGLATMKPGGRRKLVIPPDLGYGANGTPDGTIPPNATLTFDVELLRVE